MLNVNKDTLRSRSALGLFAGIQEKYYQRNLLFGCTIELLSKCQLRCIHCYLPGHHNPGLPRKVIFNLIDQLADLRCVTVGFTGGEIFLREDLLDILKRATKRNLFIRLKTNAALITKALAKKIAKNSIMQIDVSLYGHNARIHDYITGSKGSFEATTKAIQLLRENNLNVVLFATFMEQNGPFFKDIYKLSRNLGCEISCASVLLPRLNGNLDPMKIMVSAHNRNAIIKYLRSRKPDLNYTLKKKPVSQGINHLCRSTWATSLYIRSNGDAVPCTLIYQKYGNILKNPLSKILERPFKQYLSRDVSVTDIGICAACPEQNECYNCRGLAYIETKDMLSDSRLVCYYNNIRKSTKEKLNGK